MAASDVLVALVQTAPAIIGVSPVAYVLTRLAGLGLDIGLAGPTRAAQDVKDQIEADSIISKALAVREAELLAGLDAVARRQALSQCSPAVKRLVNRLAVLERLKEDLDSHPSDAKDPPSDDFLNRAERLAEDASSDEMRDLVAAILAGEIRSPGKFSLASLHILNSMDKKLADTLQLLKGFQDMHGRIPVGGSFNRGKLFSEVYAAADMGLMKTGEAEYPTMPASGFFILVYKNWGIELAGQPGSEFQLRCYKPTRVGSEIFQLFDREPTQSERRQIAEGYVGCSGVVSVTYGTLTVAPGRGLTLLGGVSVS